LEHTTKNLEVGKEGKAKKQKQEWASPLRGRNGCGRSKKPPEERKLNSLSSQGKKPKKESLRTKQTELRIRPGRGLQANGQGCYKLAEVLGFLFGFFGPTRQRSSAHARPQQEVCSLGEEKCPREKVNRNKQTTNWNYLGNRELGGVRGIETPGQGGGAARAEQRLISLQSCNRRGPLRSSEE